MKKNKTDQVLEMVRHAEELCNALERAQDALSARFHEVFDSGGEPSKDAEFIRLSEIRDEALERVKENTKVNQAFYSSM